MKNQIRPKDQNVIVKIVDAMEDNIEGAQTVAASLTAITRKKTRKAQIRVVPERHKTGKPEATHSLIATVGRVIVGKQLTKETVNPPAKILLHVLRQVKSQVLLPTKGAGLSRQAKRALRAKVTRRSQFSFLRFAHVRRYSSYVLSGDSDRGPLDVWRCPFRQEFFQVRSSVLSQTRSDSVHF